MMVDGEPEYEIERLLRKRHVRRGRGYSTEHLVRWVGYGSKHDAWYNIKDLGGAMELVREFDRQAEAEVGAENSVMYTTNLFALAFLWWRQLLQCYHCQLAGTYLP